MFDAAIIGGGLAGCSAAIALARQGRRVILLEAKTYPHHKVCGEFLSPECAALFDQLGLLPAIRALNPACVNIATISASNGTVWSTRLPGTALGISRYLLDQVMAEHTAKLGAEVRDGATVTDLSGSLDTGYTLATRTKNKAEQIYARTVIIAHGKRSNLDRALNRAFLKQPQPFIGLKCHFSNLPLPDQIELHAFPGGYCGMSEIEQGKTNVCLLVGQDIFQRCGSIEQFIGWMRRQNPLLNQRLAQADPVFDQWISIAQVPVTRKSQAENGMLVTGDAAGMIAPVAGDGMAMALLGGRMAAGYIGDFLSGTLTAQVMPIQYARQWRREFGFRLSLARFLQGFMMRPALLAPGLHLLKAIPPLGQFFLKQTRSMNLIQQQELH